MFRRSAGAVIFAALVCVGVGNAQADQLGEHWPRAHQIDCRFGMFGNCFGPDRDLLVDRLYRYSCDEAREILLDRGFDRVKTVSCNGANFRFSVRWKGKAYAVKVSRATGDIVSMKRIN